MKRISFYLGALWAIALAIIVAPALSVAQTATTTINCQPIFTLQNQPVTLCGPAILPVTVKTPTPSPSPSPTHGPISLVPSSLVFSGPTAAPTSVAVTDPGYAGTYSASTTMACITVTGGSSPLTVSPNGANPCSGTVLVSDGSLSTSLPVTIQPTPVPSPTPQPPTLNVTNSFNCGTYTTPLSACVWPSGAPPNNDILIAMGQTNNGKTITPPSGWTALYTDTGDAGSCYQSVGLWYKIASSEGTSTTWTDSASGVNLDLTIWDVANGSIPTYARACTQTAPVATGTATPTSVSSLIFAGFVTLNGVTGLTTPSGYAQQVAGASSSGWYNGLYLNNSPAPSTATPVPAATTSPSGTLGNGTGFLVLVAPVSPGPLAVSPSTLTFPYTNSAAQSSTASDPFYSGGFTATAPPAAPVNVVVSGSSITLTPNATATGTGTVTVVSGIAGQSASISYNVQATPTPTPPPATPTPGVVTITSQDFPVTASNTVNLTAVTNGAAAPNYCWAAFGYGTSLFDTKSSCGGLLSNIASINSATFVSGGYAPPPFLSWTDGTPDATNAGTVTYPQMVTSGVGNGFTMQVNAGTSAANYSNTVNVTVGSYCGNILLTAQTTDAAPAPIGTDSSFSNSGATANSNHLYHVVYSTTASSAILNITATITSNVCGGSTTPTVSAQWADFAPTTVPIPTAPPATPGPLTILPTSEAVPGPTSTATTAAISDPSNTTAFTITNTNGTSATATVSGSTSTGTITITPTGGTNTGTTTFTVSDGTRSTPFPFTVNTPGPTPTPTPFLTFGNTYPGIYGTLAQPNVTATPYPITMVATPSSMTGYANVKTQTNTTGSEVMAIVNSLSLNGGSGDSSTDSLASKDLKIYINSSSAQTAPSTNLTAGTTYTLVFTVDAPNKLLTLYICPFPSHTCTSTQVATATGVTYGTGTQSLQIGSADAAGTVKVSNFDMWQGGLLPGTLTSTQVGVLAAAQPADPYPSPTPTPSTGRAASISTSYTDANPPPYNWRPRSIVPTSSHWTSAQLTELAKDCPDAQHCDMPAICAYGGFLTCTSSVIGGVTYYDPPYTTSDGNGGQNIVQKIWSAPIMKICPTSGYSSTFVSGGVTYGGTSNCNYDNNSTFDYGIYFTGDGTHNAGTTMVNTIMHCTTFPTGGGCYWNGSSSNNNAEGSTQYFPIKAAPQGYCTYNTTHNSGPGDCHLFELDEYNSMENECWSSGSINGAYPQEPGLTVLATANDGDTYNCGSYSRGPLNIDEQGVPGPGVYGHVQPFGGSAFGDEAIGNLWRPEELVQAETNPIGAITHSLGMSFGYNNPATDGTGAVWPSGHTDGCSTGVTTSFGHEGMLIHLDAAGYAAALAAYQAGTESKAYMAFMYMMYHFGVIDAESSGCTLYTNMLIWGSGTYYQAGTTSPWDSAITGLASKGSISQAQAMNTGNGTKYEGTWNFGSSSSGYGITHGHVINMACAYWLFYGAQPSGKNDNDSCPHP